MTLYLPVAPPRTRETPMTDAGQAARVALAACYRVFPVPPLTPRRQIDVYVNVN